MDVYIVAGFFLLVGFVLIWFSKRAIDPTTIFGFKVLGWMILIFGIFGMVMKLSGAPIEAGYPWTNVNHQRS